MICPSLAGIIGRQSGTLLGFTSPAMTNAHLSWDAETLDELLTSSTHKRPLMGGAPGTRLRPTQ